MLTQTYAQIIEKSTFVETYNDLFTKMSPKHICSTQWNHSFMNDWGPPSKKHAVTIACFGQMLNDVGPNLLTLHWFHVPNYIIYLHILGREPHLDLWETKWVDLNIFENIVDYSGLYS